ncbi:MULTISPECIES: hypothetical protein [unclassified Aureispira]|uniref:hypothetical protein n=1 Tax=unclassified Aureispira TaxID=2649989 RepID=UPI000697C46F|nr:MULTISPECIES: hypothetical protein [unclassified Aureispira]WMX13849.1 hypothetical protein QP953_23640 [Aureispira sp. CCB-E]
MCNLNQGFKLCSCDSDQLTPDEIGWILERKNAVKQASSLRGKPFIYKMNQSEQALKSEVVQQLNQRNCFDFDYQPQEDDFLRIRGNKKSFWMAFRYQQGRWEEDESTKFNRWRQQLENYNKGIITH